MDQCCVLTIMMDVYLIRIGAIELQLWILPLMMVANVHIGHYIDWHSRPTSAGVTISPDDLCACHIILSGFAN